MSNGSALDAIIIADSGVDTLSGTNPLKLHVDGGVVIYKLQRTISITVVLSISQLKATIATVGHQLQNSMAFTLQTISQKTILTLS